MKFWSIFIVFLVVFSVLKQASSLRNFTWLSLSVDGGDDDWIYMFCVNIMIQSLEIYWLYSFRVNVCMNSSHMASSLFNFLLLLLLLPPCSLLLFMSWVQGSSSFPESLRSKRSYVPVWHTQTHTYNHTHSFLHLLKEFARIWIHFLLLCRPQKTSRL